MKQENNTTIASLPTDEFIEAEKISEGVTTSRNTPISRQEGQESPEQAQKDIILYIRAKKTRKFGLQSLAFSSLRLYGFYTDNPQKKQSLDTREGIKQLLSS